MLYSCCAEIRYRQNNMMIFIIISVVCVLTAADFTDYLWTNCAPPGPNIKIRFNSVSASPLPVLVPGLLTLSLNASVLQKMDVFFLQFDILRHIHFAGPIHIPCVNNVGSCTFDMCALLPTIAQDDHAVDKSLGVQIMSMLKEALGHEAGCPIHAENILITNKTMHIPEMETIASTIGDGDFTVRVTSLDIATGEIFGCLQFDVTIKSKASAGFLFG